MENLPWAFMWSVVAICVTYYEVQKLKLKKKSGDVIITSDGDKPLNLHGITIKSGDVK